MTNKPMRRKSTASFWISIVLSTSIFVGEQLLNKQAWWPSLPWNYIAGALILFAAGFLVRDLVSGNLILNSLPFVKAGHEATAAYLDYVEDGAHWIVPTLNIELDRDTEEGHLVVRVFDEKGSSFVLHEAQNIVHRKGDKLQLRLAWIRIERENSAPFHSVWGQNPGGLDLSFTDRSVISGMQYLIQVKYSWGDWYSSNSQFLLNVIRSPVPKSPSPWVIFVDTEALNRSS